MTAPIPPVDPARLAETLAQRNEELAAIDAIGSQASRSPDLEHFLDETTRVVERATRCATQGIYVAEDSGRTLVLLHQRGTPPEIVPQVSRVPLEGPAVVASAQADADVVHPAIYAARFRALLEEAGIPTLARVPLVVGSRTVGTLVIGFREADPGRATGHLQFLRAVGAIVGAFIASDRLFSDLRRRISELTLLNDVAVASAQLDPVFLLDGAVRRIAEVLGCGLGTAFLREGERLETVSHFVDRPDMPPPPPSLAVGAGACGTAVLRREVVSFASPAEVGGEFERLLGGRGLQAVVAVPLLTKDEPVGGFVLARRAGRPFTGEELRFLRALGTQLGVAVQNSRLYAVARRQLAHLEAVRSLALRAFVQPPGDLDGLLRDACRETATALDAPMSGVFLLSDEGRTMRLASTHGAEEPPPDVAVPVADDLLVLEAIRHGLARQTQDSSTDPRCRGRTAAGQSARSILAVPIGSRDVTLGVLVVADRPGRTFHEQEVALALAMAAAVAVGMENAGLTVDLDRSHAELERAQAELLHRERLAALGALSAAVAHEIRNPLGVVFNAVGMLRRHRAMDDEGRALVDMVAEESERLNRIVTDLLGFARPPSPAVRAAQLGPIVEEAVRAALAGMQAPIDIGFDLATGLPPVAVDAGLVRQAVINVVLNAVQAMDRRGRLVVRTRAAGPFAEVEVLDSGPGIPEELRERIFQPFFTTRTSGTGLGLAIVRQVVQVHGGGVEVGAGPEGGARLTLRFPLAGPR